MKEDYNLFEFNQLMKSIALAHPLINDFYTSKYGATEADNITYPAVVFSVNFINSFENTLSINFNLLYADRLTDSRDNEMAIQSVGVSSVVDIINAINEFTTCNVEEGYNITLFKEQFADNCAGVFAQATVQIPHYVGQCTWVKKACLKCV